MSNDPKQIVAEVLKVLANNNIPLEKIVLQKFIYFLNIQGVATGFKFEPYTYGPFSFGLASTLGDMDFWDEINENKTLIEVVDLSDIPSLSNQESQEIENHLQTFKKVLKNFNFDTLEIAGTVLFCIESLSIRGKGVTQKAVLDEFRAWKGMRYDAEIIEKMFQRLESCLPQ